MATACFEIFSADQPLHTGGVLNCNSKIRPVFVSSAFGQRDRADLRQIDFLSHTNRV